MAVSFCSKYRVIPGRTGRSGKNTGYRLEIENRPVNCIVVNQQQKKKNTQIPTVASTFLVATPLPLLLLLLSSSRVDITFLWTFFAFTFHQRGDLLSVEVCPDTPHVNWDSLNFKSIFIFFLILKGHKFQRHLNVQTCITFVKDASDLPLQLQTYYYYYY